MKKIIAFAILLSLILQIACVRDDKKINNAEIENQSSQESVEVGGLDKEILNRSESISNSIVELFGIDDSVTVVFNDIAIVGILLAYDKELDEELKDFIEIKVKETDSQITEVYITEKEKNLSQLNEIIIGLLGGEPYDNYIVDINKILDKVKKE